MNKYCSCVMILCKQHNLYMEGIFKNINYINENVAEIIVSIFFIDIIAKNGRNQHVSQEKSALKFEESLSLYPKMEDKKIRRE